MEQKRKTGNRNKGGRPKKGAADKLKYRLTVKMATSDYYTLKGKARSAGISAGEFLRRCMRDGQVTLRHGEQPEPACTQGKRLRIRHGKDGVPNTRGTYRRSAEFNPLMTAGYDS